MGGPDRSGQIFASPLHRQSPLRCGFCRLRKVSFRLRNVSFRLRLLRSLTHRPATGTKARSRAPTAQLTGTIDRHNLFLSGVVAYRPSWSLLLQVPCESCIYPVNPCTIWSFTVSLCGYCCRASSRTEVRYVLCIYAVTSLHIPAYTHRS